MNPKLKLALICRSSNRGFAVPITIGLGLVMILVATALIFSSQEEQVAASTQRSVARALNAVETGITRYHSLINNNKDIATYPDCDGTRNSDGTCPDTGSTISWANATQIPGMNACASSPSDVSTAAATTDWQDIDSSDSSKGQYRLVSYTYTPQSGITAPDAPGTGTLTVEGRVNQSTSRLRVELDVLKGNFTNIGVPGAWIKTGGTGNNGIQGDVLLNDCTVDLSTIEVTGSDPGGEPYQARHTTMDFPALPTPPIPGTNIPNDHVLGNLSGQDYEFPRVGDTPTPDKKINGIDVEVYEYIVDSIDLQAGNRTLTITPGKKVTFYLNGNIEKGGEIIHSCTDASGNEIADCKPTNFQIFGYAPSASNPKICTTGNKKIEAFILAPEYTGGVNGAGGSDGGIKGSIWLKSWATSGSCGSNTSNIVVEQSARWEDIGLNPENLPNRISSITNWGTKELD